LAVGGNFTSSFKYLFGIDTSNGSFDMTFGSMGLNGEVKCFYNNTGNSCLYIGGSFDAFFGSSGISYNFYTFQYSTNTWYAFDNSSGAGFTSGSVYSITQDLNSSFIVVGGDFTNSITSSGSTGLPYILTYQTLNGFSINSYFGIGTTLNNPVYSVIGYSSSGVLVGGSFTNPLTYPTWTDNYGIYISWNGSNWDLNNIPSLSPQYPITKFVFIPNTGETFTILDNAGTDILFKGSTQTPTIPIGNRWNCVTYNGSSTLYATNNQTSAGFLFYQLNQSVGVGVLASGLQTFNTNGGQGFTNINMFSIGSSFEMVYRQATDSWWVISQNSCNFS